MKLTVEMTQFEYDEMLKNKIKAEKYDKLKQELTSIIEYSTPSEFTMVRDLHNYNEYYIKIDSTELYKKVISWYKRFK